METRLYIPDVLHGLLTLGLNCFACHRISTQFVLRVVTLSLAQASSLGVTEAVDLTRPLVLIPLSTAWGLKMSVARWRQALWALSPPSLASFLLEHPRVRYGEDLGQQ